jgi:hypothetical protein
MHRYPRKDASRRKQFFSVKSPESRKRFFTCEKTAPQTYIQQIEPF